MTCESCSDFFFFIIENNIYYILYIIGKQFKIYYYENIKILFEVFR